jgi:hypothetical protein
MRVGGQLNAFGRFNPGNDPVPIVQEAGWAPGPFWTGAENLASTGIRSPGRRRSQSLYRPRYPGPQQSSVIQQKWSRLQLQDASSVLASVQIQN